MTKFEEQIRIMKKIEEKESLSLDIEENYAIFEGTNTLKEFKTVLMIIPITISYTCFWFWVLQLNILGIDNTSLVVVYLNNLIVGSCFFGVGTFIVSLFIPVKDIPINGKPYFAIVLDRAVLSGVFIFGLVSGLVIPAFILIFIIGTIEWMKHKINFKYNKRKYIKENSALCLKIRKRKLNNLKIVYEKNINDIIENNELLDEIFLKRNKNKYSLKLYNQIMKELSKRHDNVLENQKALNNKNKITLIENS